MHSFNLSFHARWVKISLLLCLTAGPIMSHAQTDSVSMSLEYFREGMAVYDFSHRKQAAELFVLATRMNPKYAQAQLMAGKCIMQTINKEQSLPYFLHALELDPAVDDEILFYIGQGYHYAEKFDSAILFYSTYNKKLSRSLDFKKSIKMNTVERKIFECRNAAVYKSHPVNVTITNLSDKINSEYPDYAPTLTADGNTMIFTSRRPENNANAMVAVDHEYYEEILEAKKVKGVWGAAQIMPDPVNSTYHNSCLNLSPDGKEMFIYNDTNGGDIYATFQVNGKWTEEVPLEGDVNTAGLENSASISNDGQKLYFTSTRPGGYGGSDIYVATKGKFNRWIDVANLGPLVNTDLDEDGVFISANGKHLYFSSNGHAGMGDLDIYRSAYDSIQGKWGVPVNLGYPINSPENDIYFVLSGDEKTAYYSSVKSENKGEQDIYMIDMTHWKEIDLNAIIKEVSSIPLAKVTGIDKNSMAHIDLQYIIVDSDDKSALDAEVSIMGSSNKIINMRASVKGNHQSQISGPLRRNERFDIRVTSPDHQEYESNFYLVGALNQNIEIIDTIFMKRKPQVQSTGVLNVYFPSESDVPQSLVDLWTIEKYLKDNISATVQISGHTDSNGDAEYNMDLSRRRAESVKNYLVKSGLPADRIIAVGFGEEKPVGDNGTSKGRSMNRRTEFAILNYNSLPRMKKDY